MEYQLIHIGLYLIANKQYLIHRRSGYSFRIRVPQSIQHAVGRKELRRSIGKRNYRKASATAQQLAWVTLHLFQTIELHMDKLSRKDISDDLSDWQQRMLLRDDEI